jgi:hypothetical protein
MKLLKHIAALALALPMAASPLSAADYYSSDFSTISAAFTIKNADNAPIAADYYNRLSLDEAWTYGLMDTKGFVALSPTHSNTAEAQENWLIAPAVSVNSAEACVVWDARSVHPDMRESYKVMVSVDGSEEFSTIFSIDEESDSWVTRSLSLADYVGHDVRVAFVCTSVNKFMLAIDTLRIGVPKDYSIFTEDFTDHLIGAQEKAAVNLRITNVGKYIASAKVAVVDTDVNCMVDEITLPGPLPTGASVEINAAIDAVLNHTHHYTAWLYIDGEENAFTLVSDKIICAAFPRKILLDKATGTWCNNCPESEVITEALLRKYGDEVIPVYTHTGDVMVNGSYFRNLAFYEVPRFIVNRNRDTESRTNEGFDTEVETPAVMGLSAEIASLSDATLSVNYSAAFAESFDNSGDKYRLGYVFTRDYLPGNDDKSYQQENSAYAATAERFYYMPAKIAPEMHPCYHVSLDSDAAFDGVPNSLPAAMNAGEVYTATLSIPVPEKIDDYDNGTLVMFILDTESGYVHNADAMPLNSRTGVQAIADDSHNRINKRIRYAMESGLCHLYFDDNQGFNIQVYSVDGRLLHATSGEASPTVTLDLRHLSGVAILKVNGEVMKIAL